MRLSNFIHILSLGQYRCIHSVYDFIRTLTIVPFYNCLMIKEHLQVIFSKPFSSLTVSPFPYFKFLSFHFIRLKIPHIFHLISLSAFWIVSIIAHQCKASVCWVAPDASNTLVYQLLRLPKVKLIKSLFPKQSLFQSQLWIILVWKWLPNNDHRSAKVITKIIALRIITPKYNQ